MGRVIVFLAASGFVIGSAVAAQTGPDGKKTLAATLGVYAFPTEGQSAEAQSADEAACYSWAVENTGLDPFLIEKQRAAGQQQAAAQAAAAKQAGSGAAAKGVVGGAAAGALIGEIAGKRAGKGAAIGAVTGAIVGSAKESQAQQAAASQARATSAKVEAVTAEQMTTFRKAFSVCLEAKKYLAKF